MEIPWNYVGSYADVAAIWAAFPNGGIEGYYAIIGGVVYRWNKYYRIWENAATVTEGTARRVDTFDGNVNIQNNLTVAGTLRAKRLKQPNCGLYPTEDALKARYPNPDVGMWAAVADENSSTGYVLYRCDEDGVWTNTGLEWEVDTDFIEEWEDRLYALDGVLRSTVDDGFYYADAAGNIAMQYTPAGGFDAAKVSEHFKGLVQPGITTTADGFYYADNAGNIAFQYTSDGLDAAKVSNHFKRLVLSNPADGFFYADASGNIAFQYTPSGGLDAAKVSDHLKGLLGGGEGGYETLSENVYNI